MKYILIILFLLNSLFSFSTNYYVGSGGNNNNNGTSIGTRWLNILKVNSSTFSSGDSILMAGGEVFNGGLIIPSNGIVVASYGTGQAIISGFTTLGSWSSVGPNLWECTPSPTLKQTCNIVTFNSVPAAVGRTPNIQYFTYSSANTTTLTSPVLISPYNNMVGAEAVIRKNNYSAEKVSITAQAGTTLTYTSNKAIDNNTPTVQNGTAGYGFFLQRFAASLDIQNEWYFNPTTNKMRIYSVPNPSSFTIKASYIDTVIYTGTHTNVTIYNLSIEGGGLYGVYIFNGSGITVKNCNFNNNTRSVYSKNGLNINISNNVMYNNFEGGIVVANIGKQINILNNIITNTGQLIGMGLFWSNFDLGGIAAITDQTTVSNFVNVIGNTVTNVGHMGIDARGSNWTVRRNNIGFFANQVDDAGGFYTWVARTTLNTTNYTGRTLDSNFIHDGIGAYLGTNGTVVRVKGAYIDDQSLNIIVRHNTIYNIPGNAVSMNNPKNITFQDNTIYNCSVSHSLVQKVLGAVTGNLISRNVEYQQLNSGQENWFHQNDNLAATGFPQSAAGIIASGQAMAVVDTNWVSNTLASGYRVWYSTNGAGMTFPPAFPLQTATPSWRSSYVHDVVSVLPPIPITNTNTTLYTNPSDNLLTINFAGFRKQDPKGNIYDHSATIGRWSSLILIDNGNAPSGGNTPPTVNAGVDKLITLPVNSTSVTATSTLGSGSSGTYTWSELSGPNTATNSSPNTATTTFGGLIAGTYQMRVKFINNLLDSVIDFMQIQVNAQPLPPVANAGADQSVQLPNNATTVSGNASSDPEGGTLTFFWAKISGPVGGTINAPNSSVTPITNMIAGTYVFSLTVTDPTGLTNTDFIQITVNAIIPPVNQPPVAEAGPSQVISLPETTAAVDASDSYDPEGLTLTYLWKQISGPLTASITNATMAATCMSGMTSTGVYIFQVTVKDPSGDSSVDALSITVGSANQNPTVFAGNDTTITLPSNSLTLTAIGTDPEGDEVTYQWVKLSGPATGTIVTPTGMSTVFNSLVQGVYILQVTVTDSLGNQGTDAVQVTVNPAPPLINPVADAGIGQTITLPTSITTLNGSATDQDGTIAGFSWLQLAGGPNTATIATPLLASTGISNLIAGTYQFQLTATDNDGLTGKDTVVIIVQNAPSFLPIASAGGDHTTSDTVVTLNGSGSDQGGTIVSYHWVKISGNTGDVIASQNNATTLITGLQIGVYVYELTVTDNDGNTATNRATVTIETNESVLLRFYKVLTE